MSVARRISTTRINVWAYEGVGGVSGGRFARLDDLAARGKRLLDLQGGYVAEQGEREAVAVGLDEEVGRDVARALVVVAGDEGAGLRVEASDHVHGRFHLLFVGAGE